MDEWRCEKCKRIFQADHIMGCSVVCPDCIVGEAEKRGDGYRDKVAELSGVIRELQKENQHLRAAIKKAIKDLKRHSHITANEYGVPILVTEDLEKALKEAEKDGVG
jgi:transposase